MVLAAYVAATSALLAVLSLLFAFFFGRAAFQRAQEAARSTIAEFKQAAQAEMDRASAMLVDLRAAQARAAGTIRTAERRRALVPLDDEDVGDDDGGTDFTAIVEQLERQGVNVKDLIAKFTSPATTQRFV